MATPKNVMTLDEYRRLVSGHSSGKHKFNAQPDNRDGQRFDSKLEASHYDRLCLLRGEGEILFFLRQVPFHLPGGVRFVVDFQVFWATGRVTFEDTKGFETETFKAKRRIVESLYPIEITIIKK